MGNEIQRPNQRPTETNTRRRSFWRPTPLKLTALVAVAILIAVGAWWLLAPHNQQRIADDRYQAVFLDDGKVFFGKLQNTDGHFLTLRDAYYTQTPASVSDDNTSLQTADQINLVKVGEEVYGPENSMAIRTDQVLFWQNLTADSQVAEAIRSQDK